MIRRKNQKECFICHFVDSMFVKLGIIGGSGFYQSPGKSEEKTVKTPFGEVPVVLSKIKGKKVAFVARHTKNHSIPPHLVNYKANIYALYTLGIDRIISTSAVGSLDKKIIPGTFVIPDQFIDFTKKRPNTFFDGIFEVTLHSGKMRSGVIHTDFSNPYCLNLRKTIIEAAQEINQQIIGKGVYICTEGPRFETPAEIKAYKKLGGTIVGMTSATESILARELGMCYSTICLVTNLAAGMQEKITAEEVYELFKSKMDDLVALIEKSIENLTLSQDKCDCNQI